MAHIRARILMAVGVWNQRDDIHSLIIKMSSTIYPYLYSTHNDPPRCPPFIFVGLLDSLLPFPLFDRFDNCSIKLLRLISPPP